jgi:hypothetical protein
MQALYGYCWMIDGLTPLIFDEQAPIYNNRGLTFDSLRHLESINVVNFAPIGGYKRSRYPRHFIAHYYGAPVILEFPSDDVVNNHMDIGKVMLTSIGAELAPVADSQSVPGFMDYVLGKWVSAGLVVSSPYPWPPGTPKQPH